MSMILLAVEDLERDAQTRDLLAGEGWWVTTVTSKEEALRAAADHAPQLLIVDRAMDDHASLSKVFSRDSGGCGVLVLLDSLDQEASGIAGDGVIARDQASDDILAKVRGSLEAPRSAQDPSQVEEEPAEAEEQLTARELFGDILVGLGEAGEPEEADGDQDDDSVDEGPVEAEAAEIEPAPVETVEAEPMAAEPSEEETEPQKMAAVEVPVPPDIAAADARLAASEVQGADAAGEIDQEETEPEPPEKEEPEQEEIESEEFGETEPEAASEEYPLGPLLEEVDPDEGESTTDLVEEVADLIESSREGWPTTEDLESGEGLSIEEVLAVEKTVDTSEPDEEDDEVVSRAALAGVPPAQPEPGESFERLGPYELLELAEFGDLTERWLARRVGGSGKTVILERVRHELRNRADVRDAFVEGNSDAAGWDHENVLSVVDLGRDGDVDYVVTAHHPGRSLAEVLDRVARMEARMPLGVSLLLIERIAAALEILAESPAVSRHGWLVPGSIWLGQGGEVVLREFGLGRLAASGDTLVRDWTEHRFSAPEKSFNRGDVRSDLYSLGALLYEMVSGKPVHVAEDYESLVEKIRSADITEAQEVDPTIPSEIDAWVMRLLRRNAQDRPQSVPEVMAKIDLALQALPARPASAELNAYVRQLFAARLPDRAVPVAAVVLEPAQPEAMSPDQSQEASGSRWEWWWLLIPLLALLSMFVGWKLMSGDGEVVALSHRPASALEVAVAAPVSAGPQLARLQ